MLEYYSPLAALGPPLFTSPKLRHFSASFAENHLQDAMNPL